MYDKHFGFEELPFSIAPDPRYLYMSEQHREALAHLIYGFNSDGGFVLLTGDVGTGKTTICRCLLEQIQDDAAIAFILNPKLTSEELLETICDEFGIELPDDKSIKLLVDRINSFLFEAHAKGRKAVLIIDEAQNLSADVLEQLRLLTNLETNKSKLLQIILLGQPELRDKLDHPELLQLSQRIVARYHLGPLPKSEVSGYIAHRLAVAGSRKKLFSKSTIDRIYRLSGGVPRMINVLCDRALLGTYTQGIESVSRNTMNRAAREVMGRRSQSSTSQVKTYAWVLSIILLVVVSVVLARTYYQDGHPVINEQEITEDRPVIKEQGLALPPDMTGGDITASTKGPAYQTIFKTWNIAYDPGADIPACDYALTKGLRCSYNQGSLRSMLLSNRPSILKLLDSQGRFFYIALTALSDDKAEITIGNESRSVPLEKIQSMWLGDYIFIWKTPPGYEGETLTALKGPVVKWLDQQLKLIESREPGIGDDTASETTLADRVKRFQLEKGLVPDGIVGAKTLVHINTALTDEIPTLMNGGENK